MVSEIVSKWWSEELNIGITEDKTVYILIDGNPIELKKEFHMNRPHWRIPGTSKRFSDLKINRSVKLEKVIIRDFLPF
jgi:hypothetical protein